MHVLRASPFPCTPDHYAQTTRGVAALPRRKQLIDIESREWRSSMRKSRLALIIFGALVIVLLFLPGFTTEVWSGVNCGLLAMKGFRPIAEDRAQRFQGKVKAYTAACRGGKRPAAGRATPWVDWSNYWATADSASESPFR